MVYLEEGKVIVFDDSFEHEAANEHCNHPRVVLVIDFWHPDLSDEEVREVVVDRSYRIS
jgi:aspartate beta-hydroxylase